MNRRRFLVGLGGVSVATTGVVGSGAFGSTEAERGVTITVEDDYDAYLRFTALDENFAYAMGRNQIEFKFDDEFRDETDEDNQGDGIGTDSVYEFAELFAVENQGTNPVQVFSIYEDDALDNVQLHEYAPNPSDEPLTRESRSSVVAPGNSVKVTMVLDTEDVDLGEYSTTIQVAAAADDSNVFPSETG